MRRSELEAYRARGEQAALAVKAKGLTVAGVCKLLGVSRSTAHLILDGRRHVTEVELDDLVERWRAMPLRRPSK